MSPEAQSAQARRELPPTEPERIRRRRLDLSMRALGEIAIVTVGILIAFALDAWWDNRSLSRQEQAHLRALASDFQQNVESLRKLIALEQSVSASSHALLLRALGRESASSEPLTPLISNVFNSARYEPVMGAYEALVNSAGLTLISDDSLRAALAQFAASVDDEYWERWSNEHYFAFAREFGGQIMLGFESKAEAEQEREFQELLHDERFQRHLALRYYSERDLAHQYDALLQQAEAVLTRVRTQIED